MRIGLVGLFFICVLCSKSYCQELCDLTTSRASESIVSELEYYPPQILKINHLLPPNLPSLITDDLHAQADDQAVSLRQDAEPLIQEHKPKSDNAPNNTTNEVLDAQQDIAQITQSAHSISQEQYPYFPLEPESQDQQPSPTIQHDINSKSDYFYSKIGIGLVHYDTYKNVRFSYYPTAPSSNEFCHFGVGYKTENALRMELLLNFLKIHYQAYDARMNESMRQKARSMVAMLNFYYDFRSEPKVSNLHLTPYLMAGLGVARHNAKGVEIYAENELDRMWPGKVTISPAWNVGLGLKYDLNESFAIDIGYRYFNYGDIEYKYFNFGYPTSITMSDIIRGHQALISFYFNW